MIYKAREKSLHERENIISNAKEGIIATAKNLLVMGINVINFNLDDKLLS